MMLTTIFSPRKNARPKRVELEPQRAVRPTRPSVKTASPSPGPYTSVGDLLNMAEEYCIVPNVTQREPETDERPISVKAANHALATEWLELVGSRLRVDRSEAPPPQCRSLDSPASPRESCRQLGQAACFLTRSLSGSGMSPHTRDDRRSCSRLHVRQEGCGRS